MSGPNEFSFDVGAAFQDLGKDETRDVTFTYTATDRHNAVSNVGIITITVTGVNDAPLANNDPSDNTFEHDPEDFVTTEDLVLGQKPGASVLRSVPISPMPNAPERGYRSFTVASTVGHM